MSHLGSILAFLFCFVVISESASCGDGYSCPDETTCCRLPNEEWGCCPFPDAECCEDHVHCCPPDTTCDVREQQCNGYTGEVLSMQRKTRAQIITEENELLCPDRRSKCPEGSTCCKLVSGKYGCCPVENANCCSDHLHCCPPDFTCDSSGQRCLQMKNFRVIHSYRKFHSTPVRSKPAVSMNHVNHDEIPDELSPVVCGTKTCPALTTCCEVEKFGLIKHMCCPLQNGVCCEDSCCPAGYHCRANGRCEKRAIQDLFSDIDF